MLGKLICCWENRRQPVELRSLEVDQAADVISLLAACAAAKMRKWNQRHGPRVFDPWAT
jgi:hypothetical protein